ncbi:hypothetical protein ACE3MQ_24865 [Paenibacillus lentus]|uniref:hypothetical protein n=1 Tax=Paenibacillus lentus TaxID=1338368 RepID=UPI00364DE39A
MSDFERKLLRILYNFTSRRHRMPTVTELERVTGKTVGVIEQGLVGLVEQQYILWTDRPNLDTIVILEGWEREQVEVPKTRINTGSTDYWTQY